MQRNVKDVADTGDILHIPFAIFFYTTGKGGTAIQHHTKNVLLGNSHWTKTVTAALSFTVVFPPSMKHRSMHSEIRCSGTTISFGIIPTGRS